MRSRPGSRSVNRMLPLGRNARLHGTSRLSISVVILKGAVLRYGARVYSGKAGVLSGVSVGRLSTGLPSSKVTQVIEPSLAAPLDALCACAKARNGVRGEEDGAITATSARRIRRFTVLALYDAA